MKDRLNILIDESEEDLDFLLENCLDSLKNQTGSATSSLYHVEVFLAVAHFVSDSDVCAFRSSLATAITKRLELFSRFDNGDPISPAYVSMTPGNNLLQFSLACSDFRLANNVAQTIGGRNEIEHEYDHAFDRNFGYTTKYLLQDDSPKSAKHFDLLSAAIGKNKLDQPYLRILHAIMERDNEELSEGISMLEPAHRRLAKNGRWQGTVHELICLWGLSLQNLSVLKNMTCTTENCFIPIELVYDPNTP